MSVVFSLSDMQSGFRSGYGCVTATLKVLNDITIPLILSNVVLQFFLTWLKLLIW